MNFGEKRLVNYKYGPELLAKWKVQELKKISARYEVSYKHIAGAFGIEVLEYFVELEEENRKI